jgi:hypothetical protein
MPGYKLIELSNLQPHKPRGIVPAEHVIGVLDFLREIADDGSVPFPKFSKWQMVGVEEVLFAARPRDAEVAAEIHARLNNAANDLQKRLLDVQVVFTGSVVCGAQTTVNYREASLPIYMIFNRPNRTTDSDGNPFYPVTFHLSSANP